MFYLKIENEKIVQAPKICLRNGYKIFGYNAENNSKMLEEDGYKAFDFPASMAEINSEGLIVKKEIKAVEKTKFSKLQIRRACRELGIEAKLNELLSSNDLFAADWNDSSEINLEDPVLLEALKLGTFSDEEINKIKEVLK